MSAQLEIARPLCQDKERRSNTQKNFFAPKHHIYISPSTFEYDNYTDNLLWKDKIDLDLLQRIMPVKRESRIARDNSEDALTWNIFRFLEKENLLQNYLSRFLNAEEKNSEIMYWSYSQSEQTTWSKLSQARQEFELNPAKGSEPDLIIKTDKTLVIIEAKLNASNKTLPTSKDPRVKEKYVNEGLRWYQNVFTSDFETLAINCRKYELLRFWLLGSWIAHSRDLKFILINLVPSEREKDIETQFKKHIQENLNRTFLRTTWEDTYRFIHEAAKANNQKKSVLKYFENKTLGYSQERTLQRAFSI